MFPEVSAVYMSDPDTRESLTSLEAINAAGDAAPSMLILPGTVLLEGEFDNDIDDNVLFGTNTETGSGYSNNQLAIDWLEHFERVTRPGIKMRRGIVHSNEWRLLIMDGHGSHLTIEFMDICWDNKIVPFKLIAHSTHLLQPYDVGFFQPMKQYHQNILAEQIRFGGSDYSRRDFLDTYNEISLRTKKKHTIKHAWEKAGLWPFKPHIVLNKMQRMEAPRRLLNSDPFRTPEPEDSWTVTDWVSVKTPDTTLDAIKPYSDYIDHRLKSAVEGAIPLSPTVSHIINKRNKAQNIIILNGILCKE